MRRMAGAALVVFFAGCGRSAESETRNWERNVAKVRELQALYPGFESVLKDRLRSAEEMWGAAKQVADEKQRADRMASANAFLMGGFVDKLDRIDGLVKAVRKKSVDAAGRVGNDYGRRAAVDDARETLNRCDSLLRQGARDGATADSVVSRVWSDLKSAESNLDRVLSEPLPTTRKDDPAPRRESQPQSQPWKCAFCGGSNDPAKTECPSCGAKRGS